MLVVYSSINCPQDQKLSLDLKNQVQSNYHCSGQLASFDTPLADTDAIDAVPSSNLQIAVNVRCYVFLSNSSFPTAQVVTSLRIDRIFT